MSKVSGRKPEEEETKSCMNSVFYTLKAFPTSGILYLRNYLIWLCKHPHGCAWKCSPDEGDDSDHEDYGNEDDGGDLKWKTLRVPSELLFRGFEPEVHISWMKPGSCLLSWLSESTESGTSVAVEKTNGMLMFFSLYVTWNFWCMHQVLFSSYL